MKHSVKVVIALGFVSLAVWAGNQIFTPIATGELIDKITILEIKNSKITDPQKRANVINELTLLTNTLTEHVPGSTQLTELTNQLLQINQKLWDIEDAIRIKERKKQFDDEFITLARAVYFTNDQRAVVKRSINLLTESSIIEEKQYTDYQ